MSKARPLRRLGMVITALIWSAAAAAQTPALDPRDWKGSQAGAPTTVLTLGSTHLSQIESHVTSDMLEPLLAKLAAFNPTVITHEGISGEQCDLLKRHAARYPGMFDSYCWPTDAAQKATGLDLAAALAEADRLLADWPASPTPAQRRRLAAVFIAAGDRPSARVQWLQLTPAERREGDGIDAELIRILTPSAGKPNETYAIAAALAARLGLQRVYAVDDHTADAIQALAGPELDPFMQELWSNIRSDLADEERRRTASFRTAADVLDYYRFINRPAVQRELVSIDHRRAMLTPSAKGLGRAYYAWWEVRNLRMVANIRSAFANHPGARVLNVVGASHKPFYDAYLDMMADVKLADAEEVLR